MATVKVMATLRGDNQSYGNTGRDLMATFKVMATLRGT